MDGGGHCFLPEDDLVKAACEILQADMRPSNVRSANWSRPSDWSPKPSS
jgi:hypothetical protein